MSEVTATSLNSVDYDRKNDLLSVTWGTAEGEHTIKMPQALAGDLVRQLSAVLKQLEARSSGLEAQQVARAIPIAQFRANAIEGGADLLLRLRTPDGLLYDFVLPMTYAPDLRRHIEQAEKTPTRPATRQ